MTCFFFTQHQSKKHTTIMGAMFYFLMGLVGLTLVIMNISQVKATSVIELQDHQFHFLKTGNWLVKFYSPDCPYCTHYALDYDKLASTIDQVVPELKVAKVNIRTNPGMAARFLIMSIPSVYYIRDKKVYRLPDFSIPAVSQFVKETWQNQKPWSMWWSPFSYVGSLLGFSGKVTKFIQQAPYGFIFWTIPLMISLTGIYLYIASRPTTSTLRSNKDTTDSLSSSKHVRPSKSKKLE